MGGDKRVIVTHKPERTRPLIDFKLWSQEHMKYWITQSGEKLAVKDMETSHIENCINYLQKKIDTGQTVVTIQYGGNGWDTDDIWYDEEEVDRKPEMKAWIKRFKKELDKRYARLAF